MLAENDLLDQTNQYRLQDTGQGLNRLQGAPSLSSAIYGCLDQTQRLVGRWVGSSVVHLGDTNVPNALMFSKTNLCCAQSSMLISAQVDKYTQVTQILAPIVTCLDNIEPVASQNGKVADFLDQSFGQGIRGMGVEGAKKSILQDWFR
jgi:hypothetical protein